MNNEAKNNYLLTNSNDNEINQENDSSYLIDVTLNKNK